jgi:3'-phosphoadenosine 5'-phosphosulfate (PAPS) 3'-phosphatase
VSGSVKQSVAEFVGFLSELNSPTLLSVGSMIKFCEIIMEKVDCYPCWSEFMVWDLIAGMAVLLVAGGRLTPMSGIGNLKILKSDLRVPSFIAE